MIHLNLDKIEKSPSPFMDRQTILENFGISKSTLTRWMKIDGLKYYKVNRRVFFKTEDFNEWFEQYKMV